MNAQTLEALAQFNQRHFQSSQTKLLNDLKKQWLRDQPLAGVHILHNIPLTLETLVKLESLIAAGAELTITHTAFAPFPAKPDAVRALRELGINIVLNHQDLQGEYDIALDCCAELYQLPNISIKRGLVELTQSGGNRLKNTNPDFPVINVDDSRLKNLECMHGTGEASLRALKMLIPETIDNKPFTLFGYGKVGRGVAKYLSRVTSDITVIETCPTKQALAAQQGYKVIAADGEIKSQLIESFAIITATGVRHLLSQQCELSELNHVYIANMGADDEIGATGSDNILFNGSAINFSLKHPTLIHFLDPIFYAHNIAAETLLEMNLSPGYYPFPKTLDNLIIDRFKSLHEFNIDDIYS